jgi:peptidoglycan/xylan/chitin deacetylase (PgdA/CDA1 family)
MHPEIVRAHQPHGIGLLLVLFALAGAAFGTLVAPGEVVAPTSAPAPACTPSPGANAAASSTPPTESPCPTPTRPTAEPTAIPTPRPTPRPTATPIPSPSPTPSPASPSRLVRHGSRTSGAVALTFDMGGRIGDALAIMDWLVAHEVRASVFMTGAMAASPNTDAGRSVLAIVDAHPDLFTLGNHSYTHRDFRTLTAAQIADELRRTEAAIAPYCTHGLRPFFRPPNGGYDAGVLAAVGAAGYRYTATWDVDTIDWRPVANDPPGPTADQIVAKVLGNARDGTIVLMHLGGYETFEALPRIVDGLRANGLRPVTLDELL